MNFTRERVEQEYREKNGKFITSIMKLHVLMVAYNRPIELMNSCCLFIRQTNPSWDLRIMHDGVPPKNIIDMMRLFIDKRINFCHSKVRNELWGHPNRKTMLEELKCEDTDFVPNN